ncbi:MAG: ferrous iron transport protein B [Candidatus Lambdaproteobacteria bacterium RIFOXYD1_FULL_56_27]|uniref:Ferrous iron transport protein B n=1 Tax=Candidatus Lambdaproteobacteria bacterium RIFOXYD2_FULL_56_26 TaxID=1817773 RepID=A0A1F6GUF2_9PROT|nr:MAG: ferrous iron transport protein B [Candidatus Lambdaproteobacteria bacterium RIFOXYC1_FULL_56_13]OGH01714.1 MAG: ferrous iron transport protein B [Candidatus Lambdaproteobacteria bacterium RIFOXYD2_FULL_56_26]OGH07599.1 MAG: ferrous iron transport protein B [Candidatus Lambdaproteobacteria bacterium RIFOXYD1_FULL_56_27]
MNQTLEQQWVQLGLVGNPNCGKTTLFNHLTGIRQRVGNWPGVTVEKKVGRLLSSDSEVDLVDLPGTYSLTASSLDEKVARHFVLSGEAHGLINIIDATNLERSLYLTLQLLEMGLPVVVALNMMDLLEKKEITVNLKELSKRLGVPVVPVVAKKGLGLPLLVSEAVKAAQKPRPALSYALAAPLKKALQTLAPLAASLALNPIESADWLALKLLEGDKEILGRASGSLQDQVAALATGIELATGRTGAEEIAEARLDWISATVQAVLVLPQVPKMALTDKMDKLVLHRHLGIPIFLLAMYLVFLVSISLSAPFIDFIDQVAGYFLVEQLGRFLTSLGAWDWIRTLVANGMGGGVQTVLTFIPPIGLMFLCLSFLEDSGYMARASFVLDRLIRKIGLPGKAVVPMIVGFGCTVPAALSCRTMQEERDRRLTLAMVPFMSCGAKLPVYALFSAAFFPAQGQNVVFGLYLIGILVAVGTGLLLKKALFHGKANPLLIELPAYHWPSPLSVLSITWSKLKRFLLEAGQLIVVIITLLTLLNSFTLTGKTAGSDDSLLAELSKAITPVFHSIGITDENWPATVGIFTGIFAKEAIIGTLDSMYSQMDQQTETDKKELAPLEMWSEATQTLGGGLLGVLQSWSNPLGQTLDYRGDPQAAAADLEVKSSSFGAMVTRFDGSVGAFAYLLWVLLYAPCVAATAAIRRETDGRWMVFTLAYMTGLAWIFSTLFYQSFTFLQHPGESLAWMAAALVLLALLGKGIWSYGQRFLRLPLEFAVVPSCTHCDSNCQC